MNNGYLEPIKEPKIMDAQAVTTVEELQAWLVPGDDDWQSIGWSGDPDVADRDGKTLFIRVPDTGEVVVAIWSRGKIVTSSTFASEAAAVQAVVAGTQGRRVRRLVRESDLLDGRVNVRKAPTSAIGFADEPPPAGQWAVVAEWSNLAIGYVRDGTFVVVESTQDVDEAVAILKRLVSSTPVPQ